MKTRNLVGHILYTLFFLGILLLDIQVFRSGQNTLGFSVLILLAVWAFIYAWRGAYAYRYLFPSLLAFAVFVILPLIYTIYIAFTNYSAVNLLTLPAVQEYIEKETQVDVSQAYGFKVYPGDNAVRLFLTRTVDGKEEALLSEPLAQGDLDKNKPQEVKATAVNKDEAPAGSPFKLKDVIKLREGLKQVALVLPGGEQVSMVSLRQFAPKVPVWEFHPDTQTFTSRVNDDALKPDFENGFYVDQNGERFGPGFRTRIGWKNFTQIFTNPSIRGPFITVFIWTIMFSLFSVMLTFVFGFVLAVILEWKALRGRKVLRSLLILPYAVPAFISILIFRGLFNPQFGEINLILGQLFGIRPEWTTNPTLARLMVLVVNLWLGYPYMMILCTGILQSVPGDIYEASAIDGGTPFSDLHKMTLPLILPPLKPLLIASFAFNFNNFLLINLLTNGAPQIVGAETAVGYTDILVTYTFNLAFRDSGSNFGFASAIATIIFIIVSVLSYINLRAATRGDERMA
jgi:maltose/maltodextrin transport system permease protein